MTEIATPEAPARPRPFAVLFDRPAIGLSVAGVFIALAMAAHFEHAKLLLSWWDLSAEHEAVHAQRPLLDRVMHDASAFGGLEVIVIGAAIAVVVASLRSRPLALVILVSVATRPLLEFTVKSLVDRARPTVSPLVAERGPSFPSGHVLAAISLWAFLPPLVELYTRRRWVWTAAVVAFGVIVTAVAAARLFLGVHWLSDVVGSMLLGALYVAGADFLLQHLERRWDRTTGLDRAVPVPPSAVGADRARL